MCSVIPLASCPTKYKEMYTQQTKLTACGVVGNREAQQKNLKLLTAKHHAGMLAQYTSHWKQKFGNEIKARIRMMMKECV